MTESTEFDVIVVGLGPGGEHVALKLSEAGLRVLGVEERLVGGECPYFGCVPSKMMIARRAHPARGRARQRAGRFVDRHARLGAGRAPDPGRGHRRLGRHGRGEAAGGQRCHVRPRAGRARGRRPGRGRGHDVHRDDGRRAQHRDGAGGATDRRPRGHAVLDQPRRRTAHRAARVADRDRRGRDRLRAGPGDGALRRAGHRGRGGRPAGRARGARGRRGAAEGVRRVGHPGPDRRLDRVGGVRRRAVHARPGRPAAHRGEAARRGGPSYQPAGLGLESVGLDPGGAGARPRRADAGGRRRLGRRRHHRQGRLHPCVDVPGRGGGRRPPRARRTLGRLPRGGPSDLHRSGGRLGRTEREGGARAGDRRGRRHRRPRGHAAG